MASIAALDGPQDCVNEIVAQYQSRRDVLARGLHEAGWNVEIPKASMYIWAQIPEPYRAMGSLEFSSVSCRMRRWPFPGIGFGEYGDEYVRFALIETSSAPPGGARHQDMFRKDGLLSRAPKRCALSQGMPADRQSRLRGIPILEGRLLPVATWVLVR